MDVPPPDEPTNPEPPPEPPILLPAADLPPLSEPGEGAIPVLVPAARGQARRSMKLAAFAACFVALAVALWVIGGEARLFLLCGMVVPPMVTLPLLAYVGEREMPARIIALLFWLVLTGLGGVGAFASAASAVPPGAVAQTLWAAAGIGVGLLVGVACFAPSVRAAVARHLPIDPTSFVHATALASATATIIICVTPLLVLGGPPALTEAATEKTGQQLGQVSDDVLLRLTCYIYAWVIASLVCFVGFPIVRTLRQALVRLGLVVPTVGQVVFAVVTAALLLVVMEGVDWTIGRLWQFFGWPQTDEETFKGLMKYAINPAGAVVVGVTAGLSEEVAVRGVLQPRLGILLSNVLFTALHALQYNWDALLSVFLIGMLLGLIRRRFNTSTSAIVHGTYDFLAVLLMYWRTT
jgi:hypothetical protein